MRYNNYHKCECCGVDFSVEKLTKPNSKFDGMYLCQKHRNDIKNNGYLRNTSPPKIPMRLRKCDYCDVLGKDEKVFIKEGEFLCRRHYDHKYLYGKVMNRTVRDKNEIIKHECYAEIILYDKNTHEKINSAYIDLEDVDKIKDYKWGYDKRNNYATTRIDKNKNTHLHQIIMGTVNSGSKVLIDHIDRDGMNNRKSNLRITNKSINAINTGLRISNKSGITGVSYSDSKSLYRSYISYDGKRIDLGWFKNKEDAIVSRLNAELKYYPDYPPQEHLFEEYGIRKEYLS